MLPFQKIDSISPATHSISIEWGDGKSDFVNTTRGAGLYHQYTLTSSVQRFVIKVQGTFNRFDIDAISNTGPASAITGITTAQLTASRNNFKSYVRKIYLGSSPLTQPSSGQGLNLQKCIGLTHFITIKGITNTIALTKFERTFKGCSNLKHIDVRGMDTTNETSLNRMFMLGKELTAKVDVSGGLTDGLTTITADTFSGDGDGTALEVGMRMYSKPSATDTIRIIDTITSQTTSEVTFTLTSGYSGTKQDNGGLRFVEPVTGVKMIGLHTFDISSLASGAGTGMNHMLTGVTINSDEVSRCIVAWANDTYGTSPSSIRFDFGTSKFFKGQQFDDINDTTATDVVSDALTTLTSTKSWQASFNSGDILVTAETGTFDF